MLSDTAIRTLKPREKNYSVPFGGGLFLEVMPGGTKSWRLRQRFNGRQEKPTLGEYPSYLRSHAIVWREQCASLYKRGISPASLKRGDEVPSEASPEAKALAETFIKNWCPTAAAANKARADEANATTTVSNFAMRWFADVVRERNKDPRNILRAIEKDIIPAIGNKQISEVTPLNILAITDAIKNRGADQMALQTRNMLKRMFAYAIARHLTTTNPAAAIEPRFIAISKSREVTLSPQEIGNTLRSIDNSNMKRTNKLALHLIMLTLVRKSMLLEARWDEIDFANALWVIPAERMKMKKPHLVPLSPLALKIFKELKTLSNNSIWVLASVRNPEKPVSRSILNSAIRGLSFNTRAFVIHDFRRTGSTLLHERGYNTDWIEKTLAHEIKGIRGIYNKAEYLEARREMLEYWSIFVTSQKDADDNVLMGDFQRVEKAA